MRWYTQPITRYPQSGDRLIGVKHRGVFCGQHGDVLEYFKNYVKIIDEGNNNLGGSVIAKI